MKHQSLSTSPTPSIEILPPHNEEAEQTVLGACLMAPPKYCTPSELAKIITPEDFYPSDHKKIFAAILKLEEAGSDISPVSVADALGYKPDNYEERDFLAEMADRALSYPNVETYARIVRKESQLRQLRRAGQKAIQMAEEGKSPEEVIGELEGLLSAVSERENQETEITLKDLADQTFAEFCEIQDGKKLFEGIRSGFPKLDSFTGGFQPKNLVVFAARPSMGKSSLLFQIAVECGKRGISVLVFTSEMSKEEVGWFALCNEAGIDLQRIKRGYAKDDPDKEADNKKALAATNRLTLENVLVVDKPSIGLSEIKTIARRWARKNPGGLVIIDHLQIINRPRKENPNLEIGFISQELKRLSRELNIPVLLASQLSRECEKRDDKRPMLSDLRDSGEVEQNADLVIFIYRDDYYNPGSGKPVELIIAKNRNGETGFLELNFIKQYRKFEEVFRLERKAA